ATGRSTGSTGTTGRATTGSTGRASTGTTGGTTGRASTGTTGTTGTTGSTTGTTASTTGTTSGPTTCANVGGGSCPRPLTCPTGASGTISCGCQIVNGLGANKKAILDAGASQASADQTYVQYLLASAMIETTNMTADYTLGDGKTG